MRTHTRPALAVSALALLLATGCSAPTDDAPAATASASAQTTTPAPTTSTTPASTAAVASPTSTDGFNTPEAATADEEATYLEMVELNSMSLADNLPDEDEELLEQGRIACMQLANGATMADVVVDESATADYNAGLGNIARANLCPEAQGS